MIDEIPSHLLRLCDAYAAHRQIARSRVSYLVRGNGQFFGGIAKGDTTITIRTAATVLRWFSDNWPDDLAWPADIPRPVQPPKSKVA